MQMCRRKGKWKCCLWKKSRVTSQGKFFIRQSPSRKPYLPSLQPTFGKLQTSFLVAASTHIYRTVSFHLPPSSLFFSSPFLFYPHTSFIDIFPRKDKIRAKGYTRFAVYISRFFLFHQLRTAAGGEVSLVSPLLREKEFECISTFPWNVLHLQLLFLNLFSRHLCPKFYGMCSNCISFFILFSFKLYACEVVRFVNCIFWCINK